MSAKIEGFATQFSDAPMCPTNYKFYNDQKGDSMCCNGKVDPQTHFCSGKSKDDVCAFIPGLPDSRDPKKSEIGLCADLIRRNQEKAEREFCPKSLPHHAAKGKCCASPSDPLTGDCIKGDLQTQKGYCLTTAERKESDRGYQVYGDSLIDGSTPKRQIHNASSLGDAEQLCLNVIDKEKGCPIPDWIVYNTPMEETQTDKGRRSFNNFCASRNHSGFCYSESSLRLGIESEQKALGESDPRKYKKPFPYKKSILNCDVVKKVFVDKDLTFPVDYTDGNGRKLDRYTISV